MGKKTTAIFDKISIRKIERFGNDVSINLNGVDINRDQAIDFLIAGYKNPDFDEASFLASLSKQVEIAST